MYVVHHVAKPHGYNQKWGFCKSINTYQRWRQMNLALGQSSSIYHFPDHELLNDFKIFSDKVY